MKMKSKFRALKICHLLSYFSFCILPLWFKKQDPLLVTRHLKTLEAEVKVLKARTEEILKKSAVFIDKINQLKDSKGPML
jgi:hypothetical protein